MAERAEFVRKIECELDKPVDEQNKAKLAFWQAELDKFLPSSSGNTRVDGSSHKWSFTSILSCLAYFIMLYCGMLLHCNEINRVLSHATTHSRAPNGS